MAKRIILWVLAIIGLLILWLLLIHWTVGYTLETGIPFVFIAGVYLVPIAFWLWSKIVKPFNNKYILIILFGMATIIFILELIRNIQGVKYLEMYDLR